MGVEMMPDQIKVLIALHSDGEIRAVMADTQNIVVVIDRTDTKEPPVIWQADWQPTIVKDRFAEGEDD